MNKTEKKELISQSTDIAFSTVSSLIGFAIGGPIGAAVGGALSPSTKLAIKVGDMWLQRRKERLINVVQRAFQNSGKNEDAILQEMMDSPDWCDTIISMIQQLANSDPELDAIFSDVMASTIGACDEDERNRLIALNASIKNMNKVQILILKKMYLAGGILPAHCIAEQVKVPELELRNAVRDLELRGMIVDNDAEPTVWYLRELGVAVAKTIITFDIMEEE